VLIPLTVEVHPDMPQLPHVQVMHNLATLSMLLAGLYHQSL
jgi:hypothetical protein